jgi:hypothetical protein
MVKNVRLLLVSALFPFAVHAFEPKVDLKGSEAIGKGHCKFVDMTYVCFVLKKDEKYYIAAVDNNGVLAVYSVSGLKQDYTAEEMKLIWQRDSQERRQNDLT